MAEAISASVTTPGFDHRVLVTRQSTGPTNYVWDDIAVRAVPAWITVSSMPFAPSYPFELIRMASASDLLVHHAPFPLTDLSLLLASATRLPPFIVHWHADLVRSAWLIKAIEPLLSLTLRRAKSIVISHHAIVEGTPILQPYAAKCVVVPYAVDSAFWSTAAASPPTPRIPRSLVAAGRLVSYKGYDVLLRAVRDLDVTLTIVGSGPLGPQLQDLAHSLGIEQKVTFAGYLPRPAMRALFQQSELFVFPSVSTAESFGLVQLEAMAAGLPVINTSIASAVPHVARHDREGLTVPPGDEQALARAIKTVLDDPAVMARMRASAKVRVVEDFGAERYRNEIAKVYQSAITSSD